VGTQTRVVVEWGAKENDTAHVHAAFHEAGLDAEVTDGYVRLSAGDLPPVTFVVVSASALFAAIAAGYGAAIGKDLYELTKRLVRSSLIRPSRSASRIPGAEFQIQDRTNGFELLFDGDEPDDAYVELFALDLEGEFAGAGVVAWNAELSRWEPVGVSSHRLPPGRQRGRRARQNSRG
jgi:hypothetical protein